MPIGHRPSKSSVAAQGNSSTEAGTSRSLGLESPVSPPVSEWTHIRSATTSVPSSAPLSTSTEAQQARTQSRRPLVTPPIPPDLPQWDSNGRLRIPGTNDPTDVVPFVFSLGPDDLTDPTPRIFADSSEEQQHRRRAATRAALQCLTAEYPGFPTTIGIQLAADVAQAFLRDRHDVPFLFPLSSQDMASMRALVQAHASTADAKRRPPALHTLPTVSPSGLSAAAESRATYQEHIAQLFALYAPHRLGQVSRLLDEAGNQGYLGAYEDLLRSLVSTYGPVPSGAPSNPTASTRPAVAISEPLCRADGSVTIYASVQGAATDKPSWSLAAGNSTANLSVGLDSLVAIGVAHPTVVSRSSVGPDAVALTVSLELSPGAVRLGEQYTVHLALLSSTSGPRARDSRTFFLEVVPLPSRKG